MTRESVTLRALPVDETGENGDFAWACHAATKSINVAKFRGATFGGSYAKAGAWLKTQADDGARAFVLIFTSGCGMEDFLSTLDPTVRKVPLAGGASARKGNAPGYVFPSASEVAALAIFEGNWQSVSVAAHEACGEELDLDGNNARRFAGVRCDGEFRPAHDFLITARREHALAENDWGRLALIDQHGSVFHLHDGGNGTVGCGANLPHCRKLRLAVFNQHQGGRNISQIVAEGSLAFGCAGLHGLFGDCRPWESGAPTSYLFGELATTSEGPRFANLMFSVLKRLS